MNPPENQNQPGQAPRPADSSPIPSETVQPVAAAPTGGSLYPTPAAPTPVGDTLPVQPTAVPASDATSATTPTYSPQPTPAIPPSDYRVGAVAQTPVVVGADSLAAATSPTDFEVPNPKKTWLKRIMLGFGVLVVFAVIGVAAVALMPTVRGKLQASGQRSALKQLQATGNGATAATVAKLSPTDTFFAVWERAAEQPIVTTTSSYSYSDSPNDDSQPGDLRQVGFNYTNKQFSYQQNSPDITGGAGVDQNRCIGAQEYYLLASYADSGWQKSDNSDDCTLKSLPLEGLNDGLNAGGLTSAQAETFARSLRKTSGLLTVNGLKLTNVQGKALLRFDVTVKPVKSSLGYFGMQYFMWSFKDTGVDPGSLPYTYLGAGGDGAHFAYYVDPGTQLPVYSQIVTTPHLDDSGKPDASNQTYDFYHVEYRFGGSLPTVNITDTMPLKLQWPTEKL